jgi:hypothetical protein
MPRFFKKSINLDCYTSNANAYNFAKVDHANKFLPSWWKDMPPPDKGFPKQTTIKNCSGFTNHFKYGFVIPMWSDLSIKVSPKGLSEYRYQFADGRSELLHHPAVEWGKFKDENTVQHIKLISPWIFSCNEDIDFLFIEPSWNFPQEMDGIKVLPGTVNYYWQTTTHINLMLEKGEEPRDYGIQYHTPMAHIIPLTDRKVNLNVHLVSEEEIRQKSISPVSFSGSISKIKKTCPFGFGK